MSDGRQHNPNRSSYDSSYRPMLEPGEVVLSGPEKSINGWILFVTGLNEEVREEDVSERFGEFGSVKSVQLPRDRRTGYCKGYSLVEYNSFTAAQDAINALHGVPFMGSTIRVNWAYVKPASNSMNMLDIDDEIVDSYGRVGKKHKLR